MSVVVPKLPKGDEGMRAKGSAEDGSVDAGLRSGDAAEEVCPARAEQHQSSNTRTEQRSKAMFYVP